MHMRSSNSHDLTKRSRWRTILGVVGRVGIALGSDLRLADTGVEGGDSSLSLSLPWDIRTRAQWRRLSLGVLGSSKSLPLKETGTSEMSTSFRLSSSVSVPKSSSDADTLITTSRGTEGVNGKTARAS